MMRQFDAARSKQVGILQDKTIELQCKELKEANHKHTSVYVSQSFRNNCDSDSDEPEECSEEDPEEEPEEDPEEEPEEEPEEDPEEEPEKDLEMELVESTKEQTQGELIEGSEVEPEDDQEEDSSEEQDGKLAEEDPEEEPEEEPEEDPEEDPEEEPEEDLEMELVESTKEQTQGELIEGSEVEPEDDQEEDSSEEQDGKLAVECSTPFKSCDENFPAELTEHEDEYPSADCVFEPNPESETETAYQNSSDGKQRIMVNTAEPSLSQNYGLEKNCKYDEAVKQELNIKSIATDQHSVPGGLKAVGDENSGKQTNSGIRRRSRWDQDPEADKKTVIEDGKFKKRKTRWDADDSKSGLQVPLQLTDLGKGLCGSLLDWEVQALKKRYLEISSILDPSVDSKLGIIKEREKIFLQLAKRNAIFCKELYIPVKEYPTYNFVGLILGPKGNTQKRMEMESGAKIRLRGKGSSKSAQEADPSEDKDLHVCIEAISQKSLDAAVCMVEKLLIPVEEGMNDHKRAQLQELYNLKTASKISSCSVCKEPGHNHFACPQKKSTLKAACDTCGSFSHLTSGCPVTRFSHLTSGCPVTPLNLKIKCSKEISPANLYVGCLPQTVNDSRLRELFSPFGTITESKVIIDHITGYSKGYGFVRFDTPSAASLAIMHMNGYQMDGHRLAVRIAGTSPATVSPATSLLPVYPVPGLAAVATSSPALPHYMLPEAQVSVLNSEGLDFPSMLNMEYRNQISQTGVPVIPQGVSGSTGLSTAFSSTGFMSRSTELRTALLSTDLVSGPTESRIAFSSTGLVPLATGPPATSLLPVHPIPGPAAVTTSCPTLPHYMMQEAQLSVLNGEGLGFSFSLNMECNNQFSQTRALVIPQGVSGSTGSNTTFSSTGFVSRSAESTTAHLSTGLVSGSTESRTGFSSTGLVSASTESRSEFSSTSFGSIFPGDPDYPGSGLQSYFT